MALNLGLANEVVAPIQQPLANLATGQNHLKAEAEQFLAKVDPNDDTQIFAPEQRGIGEQFEVGKATPVTFVPESTDNKLEWSSKGKWSFGLARICVTVKGEQLVIPVDSEQASAIFLQTLRSGGALPPFFAVASMRERSADENGNARKPLKVVTLYTKPEVNSKNRIGFAKVNGKVDTNFVVTGW